MARQPKEKSARSNRFLLRLTPEEAAIVQAKAASAGLPVSVFCRNAALGKKINSNIDLEAILFLTKLSGDQGRRGGLLKLWLSERPGEGAPQIDVLGVLKAIEDLRPKIWEAIDRL